MLEDVLQKAPRRVSPSGLLVLKTVWRSLWTTAVIAAAHITQRPTAAAATLPAPTAVGCAVVSPATWEPAASARRVRSTTSTSVPAVRPRASRCAAAAENAAVTSACATSQSLAKSTAPSASVMTSPVLDTRAHCAQVKLIFFFFLPLFWLSQCISKRKFLHLNSTMHFNLHLANSIEFSVQIVQVYGPYPSFSVLSLGIHPFCLPMGLFIIIYIIGFIHLSHHGWNS